MCCGYPDRLDQEDYPRGAIRGATSGLRRGAVEDAADRSKGIAELR